MSPMMFGLMGNDLDIINQVLSLDVPPKRNLCAGATAKSRPIIVGRRRRVDNTHTMYVPIYI
jgi:hypothetical protein